MDKAFIVVGLSFGDESKGTIVDFLTKEYNSNLTVRFSGGSQCGHNVENDNGQHHCFSQFGSGSFQGARTLLSKYVLIDPTALDKESNILSMWLYQPLNELFIDENAVVITPFHIAANRLIESKGNSTGMGCWETQLDHIRNPKYSIKIKDFKNSYSLYYKLLSTRNRTFNRLHSLGFDIDYNSDNGKIFKNDTVIMDAIFDKYLEFANKVKIINQDQVNELINTANNPIFEGNQGIALDPDHGFMPYVTANSSTSHNAFKILKDCNWPGNKEVIGVTRIYTTRHGTGPFVTEDPSLARILTDKYNVTNEWQGNFRFGWLDLNLLKYCVECDGHINSLAITHCDELSKLDYWQVCESYQDQVSDKFVLKKPEILPDCRPNYSEVGKDYIVNYIEASLGLNARILSCGPKTNDKQLNSLISLE